MSPPYRIGHGVDIHRIVAEPNSTILIGGVAIPSDFEVVAHSDGDVVLHALCDAILGAIGAGDIGTHFPDTDPKWKDCDSTQFVHEAMRLAKAQNYSLLNTDITLLAEKPKIAHHRAAIVQSVAQTLDIDLNCVNVKATTTEGLGFVGAGEGIMAHATILLEKR